jgi:hypothetical protein
MSVGITYWYRFAVEISTMTLGEGRWDTQQSLLVVTRPDSSGRGNLFARVLTNDEAQMPNETQSPNHKTG